jgi:hypothetical protein
MSIIEPHQNDFAMDKCKFFSFFFFDVVKVPIIPPIDLAKVGYKESMKFRQQKDPPTFLATY